MVGHCNRSFFGLDWIGTRIEKGSASGIGSGSVRPEGGSGSDENWTASATLLLHYNQKFPPTKNKQKHKHTKQVHAYMFYLLLLILKIFLSVCALVFTSQYWLPMITYLKVD